MGFFGGFFRTRMAMENLFVKLSVPMSAPRIMTDVLIFG
jgi:hypothetical protein